MESTNGKIITPINVYSLMHYITQKSLKQKFFDVENIKKQYLKKVKVGRFFKPFFS